jgi:arylsulfatase A-like enzyme
MGVHDGDVFGSRYFKTPQLSRLARDGMLFTQGYAAAPVCSPTRAALLTGKAPARLHLTTVLSGQNDSENAILKTPETNVLSGQKSSKKTILKIPDCRKSLPKEELTLAEALKQCGYRSASIGKWHLGGKGSLPEDHGFDVNIGGSHIGQAPSYYSPYSKGNRIIRGLEGGKEGEYLTDRLTDEAIKFIESSKDQPFFLYLPHYAVHGPLEAKKELLLEEAKQVPAAGGKKYAIILHAMISSVDQSVGRILDALERLKLSDNTIVIFTSDNGGPVHQSRPTGNAPQRLDKGYPYEGGVRVPLIIKAPGLTKPGSTSSVPMITTDFFPTLLALADAKGEVKRPAFDGLDMSSVLKGGTEPLRDQLCWHYPHYFNRGKVTPYSVIRRGDMKLIRFWETGKEELYDLANDISEARDLAASKPEIRADLAARLDAWLKETGAQIPQKN